MYCYNSKVRYFFLFLESIFISTILIKNTKITLRKVLYLKVLGNIRIKINKLHIVILKVKY